MYKKKTNHEEETALQLFPGETGEFHLTNTGTKTKFKTTSCVKIVITIFFFLHFALFLEKRLYFLLKNVFEGSQESMVSERFCPMPQTVNFTFARCFCSKTFVKRSFHFRTEDNMTRVL